MSSTSTDGAWGPSVTADSFAVPLLQQDLLPRTRLLELGAQRLLLVRAPAGYGKTVAVAHWARAQIAQGTNLVWVRGAMVDRDYAWETIGDALRAAVERESAAAYAHVVNAEQRAGRQDVRAKMLAGALRRDTVIVIDGYEGLTSRKLDLGLLDLVQQSDNVRLVIVGRSVTELDSPLTYATVATRVITETELLLTEPELTTVLLGQHARSAQVADELTADVDGEALDYLSDVTSGWPLATHALLTAAESAVDQGRDRGFSRIHRAQLQAHLSPVAESFLSRLGAGTPRSAFLAITACPDISAGALVDALGGGGAQASSTAAAMAPVEAAEIHRALEQLRDFGLVSVMTAAAGGPRYRSLLGTAVLFQHAAIAAFTEEGLRELRRGHAADLSAAAPFDAIGVYLELEDFDSAEQLMRQHLNFTAAAGDQLNRQLRSVPFAKVVDFPVLAVNNLGLNLLSTARSDERVRAKVQLLEERLTARIAAAAVAGDDVEWSDLATLSYAARLLGSHKRARELAAQVADFVHESETLGERDAAQGVAMPMIYCFLGLSYAINGELEAARGAYWEALERAETLGSDIETARALAGLALCGVLAGDVAAAREFAARAWKLQPGWGQTLLNPAVLELAPVQALLAASRGDDERVQQIYDAAWPIRHRLETWPLIALAESEIRHRSTGAERALNGLLSFFDEPQEVVQGTDYLKQRLIAQAARLSFLQGQFQQGEELLVRLPENDPERILAEVQGALLAGATTAARLLVGRLVSGELTLRQQRDYLLACAVVAWQLDENEIAFEHLRLVAPIGSRVEALEALSMLPYPELHGLASAAAGAGEAWLAEVLAELPEELRAQRFELLSKAELRALRALQGAASLEQIAATLFISLNTLKYHLRNVYRKLNVSGRDGAVRRATAMGLFEEPDEVAVA